MSCLRGINSAVRGAKVQASEDLSLSLLLFHFSRPTPLEVDDPSYQYSLGVHNAQANLLIKYLSVIQSLVILLLLFSSA